MVNALESLFPGIILGLVAGLSPGPMLALVIAETLKFGKDEGFKVAVSPLVTDSTIILITLLVLSTLAEYDLILGIISIFGACYLIRIGLGNLGTKLSRFEVSIERKEAFKRAIITNLVNPHTYLFWLSVGSPIIFETLKTDASATIFFLVGFYAFLIGSMTFVAFVVDRSKSFIKSKYYSYVVRLLGIILIFFALTVLVEGLSYWLYCKRRLPRLLDI
jgi:threonine/homoserine/homoserine lactone efflux protein